MKAKNVMLTGAFCYLLYGIFSCQSNQQPPATNLTAYQNSICKQHEVRGPVYTLQMYRTMIGNDEPKHTPYNRMMVFNRQGYLIDIRHRTADLQWHSINTYDSVRWVFTEHSTNAGGMAISTVESYYDTAGNEVCRKSYQSDIATELPDYMECYQYDKKNNLIERDYYQDGQHLTSQITYEFNKANQQVKSINYENSIRDNEYSTYVYDKAGNLTEENTYSNGKLHHINQYTPDKYGNPLEAKSIYPDRNVTLVTKRTYEYDKYDNWILQQGTNNDQSLFKSERLITYY